MKVVLSNTMKKKLRQEKILLSLVKLGFVSRSQLQVIHKLGTDRNACRVLRDLREYVNYFRMDETIYYINKAGINLLGVDKEPLKKSLQVEHYLMRNDLYIYYQQPVDWKLEPQNKYTMKDGIGMKSKTITSDARFTKNGIHHFVEIDNTQQMKANRKKIELYKEFNTSFKQQFKQTPTIIFYTVSENRKKKLDEWMDRAGLFYQVFTKKDIWRE